MSLVRPADAVVVALAALLVGASWAALWSGGGPAEHALLSAPGMAEQRVSLAREQSLAVTGRMGVSELEVRAGRIRFTDSPCVGRYCVHAGWLSRSGHAAACLPNGVIVEVIGATREFDAVTF